MIARSIRVVFFVALFVVFPSAGARAENWPQWRGARLDGISSEKGLPTTWSGTENIAWRLPLPGPGGATPVVWDDHIFLTTVDGADVKLLCVGTDGQKRWERLLDTGNREARGDEGNSASNSPCTDGQHVWAMSTLGGLACFDFEGNEVWRCDLEERYGTFNIAFGLTSTPVLDGDRLYLQLLHTDGNLVVALDKATGKEVWKHTRQSDAHGEPLHTYASPVIYQDDKRKLLLTHGADYIVAHQLDDGSEVWRCGGLNPPPNGAYREDFRFVSSPVAVPGLVIVPSCKNGLTLAVSPFGKGNITDSKKWIKWAHTETPDVPSPLVHDGLVYLCSAGGIVSCLDAKSGEQVYLERAHEQRHRASPVLADNKLYLTARDGVVTVVKPGRKFEILATNELGEDVAASPAIANARIYFRTSNSLIAVEQAR